MSYSETITYDAAASLNFDSTKVEVAAGTVRLKDLGGSTYSTTAQAVTSQHQNTLSALTSFAEVSTLPASTAITYQLVLNGVKYWYNATAVTWQLSDGTVTQSNTAAVINSQAANLVSQLSLITPQFVGLQIYLATSNAANRPVLTSNTIGYTWANQNPATISQCLITGYLSDLVGVNPIPTAAAPITLLVSSDQAFFHGSRFVVPFTRSANFDTNGLVSLSVIETATPGVKLKFSLTYYDGRSIATAALFSVIVPNQPSITLNGLSTVVPTSFG